MTAPQYQKNAFPNIGMSPASSDGATTQHSAVDCDPGCRMAPVAARKRCLEDPGMGVRGRGSSLLLICPPPPREWVGGRWGLAG